MEYPKESIYEKEKKEKGYDEKKIISVLEEELSAMEQRKPDIRQEGTGDAKYEILFSFIRKCKDIGFEKAYSQLEEYEKHAIITRLENQSLLENFPYKFIEKLSRELYGVIKDKEGELINFAKKAELEQILQDLWKKRS